MAEMLKISEVAKELGVVPATVRKMLEEGEMKGVKIRKTWRVPAWALSTFIQEQLSMDRKPQ